MKSSELCARFEIKDRQLRAVGNRSGLATEFAISSDKGFKHVAKAGRVEYLRFTPHAPPRDQQLVRVRNLDHLRNSQTWTIKRPAFTFKKDSG